MQGFSKDIRHAVRLLLKKPGFTLIVVATLALGIGANTAIFSFVDAILLEPLAFQNPDRLVRLTTLRGGETGLLSLAEVDDLRRHLDVFEGVAPYLTDAQYNISSDNAPMQINAVLTGRELFEMLGTKLLFGEVWPEEYDRQRSFGVVLSHGLWKRAFGGDPNIVGKTITADLAPYTVFGVLPEGFEFPYRTDLYRCIGVYPDYEDRSLRYVEAVARLKEGVSLEEASEQLRALGLRLAQDFPDTNAEIAFGMTPLEELYVGNLRPYLMLLLGAVTAVLLIVCVNVVNLLLSRAMGREKEIAVRVAMGVGRLRLIRQLLTESLTLSLIGGAAGVLLAHWSVSLGSSLVRVQLPPWIEIGTDAGVLLFALAISLATGILAGLAPALQASRPDFNELLKDASRGSSSGSRRRNLLRQGLVVAEVTLAVVLLAGAGLMVKSFSRLQQADLGFEPENLVTFQVALTWKTYRNEDERITLFKSQMIEQLQALPGVSSAAINSNLPLTDNAEGDKSVISLQGQSISDQQRNPFVNSQRVSEGYLDTMKIRLVRGRFLEASDRRDAPPVAVVNRQLADRLWPDQDPLEQRLKVGEIDSSWPWMSVIGVVENVRHSDVSNPQEMNLYYSAWQRPDITHYVVVRTSLPTSDLEAQSKRIVQGIDAQQTAFNFHTYPQRISDRVWQRRLSSTLFAVFAALAAALSAIGIYGVMSYAVGQRTREMGIRRALGASGGNVLRMVLGESLRLALFGVALGVLAALGLAFSMSSMLYAVNPVDPIVFLSVPALLGLVALAAGLLPALRASRIDPIIALRDE